MKKPAVYFIIVMVITVFYGSCTSAPGISVPKEKFEQQNSIAVETDNLNITSPYTIRSLLLPVLQMNNYMMSLDYFGQFLEYNDYIFPDYLFILLAMEANSYKPGEGTLLVGDSGSGLPVFKFEKAFLSKTENGDSWWRFYMQSSGEDLLLEILVNPFGIPAKIRFENTDSGQKFEIVPDIAIDFERAMTEVTSEQLSTSVSDKINRSIEDGFSNIFVNPVIKGEEIINTPAGEFKTVLVQDFQTQSYTTNYWLSPDVPGGIVRISVTDSTGLESHVTELKNINKTVIPYISETDIIPYTLQGGYDQGRNPPEPGYSEGSIESPVGIYPEEYYYGSVSDEGVSYYKFINTKRSDLYIEVSGLEGNAGLVYFGNDSSFENLSTSREWGDLNVEDYMVLPGETVYFSVNDIADEYSVGEHYTIYIDQNPILDPIGIMMKGDIYNSAVELESGKSYVLIAGSEGLDYYKTTVKKGSTLLLEILNEPDFGSLEWFDTLNGPYSGMSSEWGSNGKTIKIEGLEPGTVCYYYFTSDTDLLDPLQKLELQITEIP